MITSSHLLLFEVSGNERPALTYLFRFASLVVKDKSGTTKEDRESAACGNLPSRNIGKEGDRKLMRSWSFSVLVYVFRISSFVQRAVHSKEVKGCSTEDMVWSRLRNVAPCVLSV